MIIETANIWQKMDKKQLINENEHRMYKNSVCWRSHLEHYARARTSPRWLRNTGLTEGTKMSLVE